MLPRVPYPLTWPRLQAVERHDDGVAGEVITPHAAVSALVVGALSLGSTHLHDCDVRLCVSTLARSKGSSSEQT